MVDFVGIQWDPVCIPRWCHSIIYYRRFHQLVIALIGINISCRKYDQELRLVKLAFLNPKQGQIIVTQFSTGNKRFNYRPEIFASTSTTWFQVRLIWSATRQVKSPIDLSYRLRQKSCVFNPNCCETNVAQGFRGNYGVTLLHHLYDHWDNKWRTLK